MGKKSALLEGVFDIQPDSLLDRQISEVGSYAVSFGIEYFKGRVSKTIPDGDVPERIEQVKEETLSSPEGSRLEESPAASIEGSPIEPIEESLFEPIEGSPITVSRSSVEGSAIEPEEQYITLTAEQFKLYFLEDGSWNGPEYVRIKEALNLRKINITSLPVGLHVGGGLYLCGTNITSLPESLDVGGHLELGNCSRLTSLPSSITQLGPTSSGETRVIDLTGTNLSAEVRQRLQESDHPGI